MFNSNNFIVPYANTDLALVFQDSNLRRVKGINVCTYLNSGAEDNVLWVLLEGNSKLVFDFISESAASSAAVKIAAAIDTLQPNCAVGGGGSPIPPQNTAIPILLDAYIALVDSTTTEPFQWYDIIDANNNLGKGANAVFRVLSLNESDRHPAGIVYTTNEKVVLDVKDYSIDILNDLTSPINSINSKVNLLNSTQSTYVYAINNSVLGLETCSYIYASKSVLTAKDCVNLRVFNSNVQLDGANNVEIDGITKDLTTFDLQNVKIDRAITTGKEGRSDITLVPGNTDAIDLSAYENTKIQRIKGELPLNANGTIRFNLFNYITEANAEFNFELDAALDFSDGVLEFYDVINDNLIETIPSAYKGKNLKFIYDKVADAFYLDLNASSSVEEKVEFITVASDEQTEFLSVLTETPVFKTKAMLFVNGQKQAYGVDFTITDKTVNWLDADFTLETTDKLEIRYR